MNILVVSAADATNLSIENVVKEFVKRGHHVEVFAQFADPKSIRMFQSLGLTIRSVKELTLEKMNSFDIAFCGTDAIRILRWADIYIFSYNFIFVNRWPSEGSDFMFTICNAQYAKKGICDIPKTVRQWRLAIRRMIHL